MKPIISDKNPHSGDTVHEYEVYKMLSAMKKKLHRVLMECHTGSTSIVLLNLHPFLHILLIKLSTMVILLQCGLKLLSLLYQRRLHPLISLILDVYPLY